MENLEEYISPYENNKKWGWTNKKFKNNDNIYESILERMDEIPSPHEHKVISELENYDGKILEIYPNIDGYFQFSDRIRECDIRTLDYIVDYLKNNGATKIYAHGSSLYKADYKDIDLIATVPDVDTGAKIVNRIEKSEIKGIEIEDLTGTEYFPFNSEYRIRIKKGKTNIDLCLITESNLEKQIE